MGSGRRDSGVKQRIIDFDIAHPGTTLAVMAEKIGTDPAYCSEVLTMAGRGRSGPCKVRRKGKFTQAEVDTIREMYKAGDKLNVIWKVFADTVSKTQIHHILNGRRLKPLEQSEVQDGQG